MLSHLQERYTQLCAQLGDAEIKRTKFAELVDSLKKELVAIEYQATGLVEKTEKEESPGLTE